MEDQGNQSSRRALQSFRVLPLFQEDRFKLGQRAEGESSALIILSGPWLPTGWSSKPLIRSPKSEGYGVMI
jgi:hypothetical protein